MTQTKVICFDGANRPRSTPLQIQTQLNDLIEETEAAQGLKFQSMLCQSWNNPDLNHSSTLVYTLIFEEAK